MAEKAEKFPQTIAELGIFIEKYQDRFVRHAFFKLGNRQDAEDVVQDVLVRIFNDRSRFSSVRNPFLYVMRMVANASSDMHRKADKRKTGSIDEIPVSQAGIVSNCEDDRIAREEYLLIQSMMEALPLEQKEILHFRLVDGMQFTSIAEMLDLPVTTVKSRFKYGIDKLRVYFNIEKEVSYELQ